MPKWCDCWYWRDQGVLHVNLWLMDRMGKNMGVINVASEAWFS